MLERVTDTRVDLSASGARFGAGAFETLRLQDGRPRWLPQHLERLAAACAFLGLEEPPGPGALLEGLELPAQGVLRLLAVDRTLLVWTGPLEPAPSRGLCLGLSRDTRRHPGPLTRHKTTSYLENLRLAAEARDRGLDEVIAPTPQGRLSDGGRSTLVALLGNRLLTPPLADGALPGAQAVALVSALRGLRTVSELEGLGSLNEGHPGLVAARALLA